MNAVRTASLALVLVTALLQSSLMWRLDVLGVPPDLLITVVAAVALLTGPVNGAMSGFAAGVALAVFSALPLGPHAMLATLVAYGIGRVGEQLVTDEHPVPPVLATIFACACMSIGRPVVEFLVNPASPHVEGMWRSAFVSTTLGAVLAVPVYLVVRRLLVAAARSRFADGEVTV